MYYIILIITITIRLIIKYLHIFIGTHLFSDKKKKQIVII